ncbi:MAG: tRNA uridine-5-carboxymethylaminomethyl(34) synthesis GTPase MnmE [Syntrophomonadaceae bacterium]|nr:tRNA uridine-5-carboxymethylaminomethyl(34) synthesis GTPase MnmE [Syntrophomonadaceae bacterium]
MLNDDIAAISTPPGEGGIAIVRLSGQNVAEKISAIFKPYNPGKRIETRDSHTLTLGWLLDDEGDIIDEVLVSIMKAPHSYTGENVIEINCHGGNIVAQRCLEAILALDIRLAEAGEFTRRAFLNGRLDISQAEAVIEVIRAKSEKSLKLAIKQLTGHNSQYMTAIEEQLLKVNAHIQASIDFPDEVGDVDINEVSSILAGTEEIIEQMLEESKRTDIYRQGISVAIIGKPNVGKSSLLNALLRKNRAIVTNIPGTTRDTIEEHITIGGIPVKLIDTAGIRITEDMVEQLGVKKSEEVISEADLVIWVLDFAAGITEEDMEIYNKIAGKKRIVLVNKEDLELNISEAELNKLFTGERIIKASVKEDSGIKNLEKQIAEIILSGQVKQDDLKIMLNMRQKSALKKAKKHIHEAQHIMHTAPLDCLAIDLELALESIGELTGKNIKEEVLNRIFHDFCIGK